MLNDAVMEIIKLDTADMYKLFYSLCNDRRLVDTVKWGAAPGLAGIELSELINPAANKKPKSDYLFIGKYQIPKQLVRAEVEARTKLMVSWFAENLGAKSITADRSKGTDASVSRQGVNFDTILPKVRA